MHILLNKPILSKNQKHPQKRPTKNSAKQPPRPPDPLCELSGDLRSHRIMVCT